jgi:S-adenosylmethionine:tRNA ribosyltransferase-isomerase
MTNLFDYDLPSHLIAQHPVSVRDQSRLMVLDRSQQTIEHRHFFDLSSYLQSGDLLVLNNTRVLPARLVGHRERTGGQWEGLFIRTLPTGLWEMMAQTRGKPEIGETILIDPEPLKLTLRARTERYWEVEPSLSTSAFDLLQQYGHIPLPPYIRKGKAELPDHERYQTVYAQRDGSIAAPTAGLHFTPQIFQQLDEQGVGRAYVTLHVGLGTFEPIRSEDPTKHPMHSEWCEVPQDTVDAIRKCKDRGNRVFAVGTTTTRTLESWVRQNPNAAWKGETSLFIYPPFEFRVIDGLITNFHLPRTTLLLLVSAFAGTEFLQKAYEIAVREEYRFFSYGDAMLIV